MRYVISQATARELLFKRASLVSIIYTIKCIYYLFKREINIEFLLCYLDGSYSSSLRQPHTPSGEHGVQWVKGGGVFSKLFNSSSLCIQLDHCCSSGIYVSTTFLFPGSSCDNERSSHFPRQQVNVYSSKSKLSLEIFYRRVLNWTEAAHSANTWPVFSWRQNHVWSPSLVMLLSSFTEQVASEGTLKIASSVCVIIATVEQLNNFQHLPIQK